MAPPPGVDFPNLGPRPAHGSPSGGKCRKNEQVFSSRPLLNKKSAFASCLRSGRGLCEISRVRRRQAGRCPFRSSALGSEPLVGCGTRPCQGREKSNVRISSCSQICFPWGHLLSASFCFPWGSKKTLCLRNDSLPGSPRAVRATGSPMSPLPPHSSSWRGGSWLPSGGLAMTAQNSALVPRVFIFQNRTTQVPESHCPQGHIYLRVDVCGTVALFDSPF